MNNIPSHGKPVSYAVHNSCNVCVTWTTYQALASQSHTQSITNGCNVCVLWMTYHAFSKPISYAVHNSCNVCVIWTMYQALASQSHTQCITNGCNVCVIWMKYEVFGKPISYTVHNQWLQCLHDMNNRPSLWQANLLCSAQPMVTIAVGYEWWLHSPWVNQFPP